jgi:hypothetical protein
MTSKTPAAALFLAAVSTVILGAQTTAPTPAERVAALKASLAASQTAIRKYEWIETTVLSLKGEEKSRKQLRCYYGADGKLQKLPVEGAAAASKPAPQASSGGRRGGRLKENIIENKKDEMQEYMASAVALVHKYLPPNPALLQKAKDAGKVAVTPADQGRIRLDFTDYLQPGDRLSAVVNGTSNALVSVAIATYLDKKDDVVSLDVQFGSLADGTSYTSQTTLDAKAKNVRVVIQNTGHKPIAK